MSSLPLSEAMDHEFVGESLDATIPQPSFQPFRASSSHDLFCKKMKVFMSFLVGRA